MKTIVLANHNTYRGVALIRLSGKWQAQIVHGRRSVYLGCYDTPEQAALVVDLKAKELHGDRAILNFPGADLTGVAVIHRSTGPVAKPKPPKRVWQEPHEWLRTYQEPQNLDGFSDLSTDEHAYWLGFIAADGCVFTGAKGSTKTQNVVRLSLKGGDADHLRTLRGWLGTAVPVRESARADGYKVAVLALSSKKFVDALRAWGVTERKSLTISFPPIPLTREAAFIRGYFDGNGSIYGRKRQSRMEPVCRFSSGSRVFLEAIADRLETFDIKPLRIFASRDSHSVTLPISATRENLINLYHYLYPAGCVSLPRKRDMFKSLIPEVLG